MNEPLRLAMWSGPRNISTAMMRSWGQRDDTIVWDEPFYAHYLRVTGKPHPGAAEVITHHETDWRQVVAGLTGDLPEGKSVSYQKHMAHHLLPDMGRDWLEAVTHAFLVREPREMLTSLIRRTPNPGLEDTGLPQQREIFRLVEDRTGTAPVVLDAKDVLDDPRRELVRLCTRVGVEFTVAMLEWPPGHRDTDGVWARHWYDAVERSTRFQPYRPKPDPVPPHLTDLLATCQEIYDELAAHRGGAETPTDA